MIVVRFVGADGMSGMIDASITRSFRSHESRRRCRRRRLRPLPVPSGPLTWRFIRIQLREDRLLERRIASIIRSRQHLAVRQRGEGGVTSGLRLILTLSRVATVSSFCEKVVVESALLSISTTQAKCSHGVGLDNGDRQDDRAPCGADRRVEKCVAAYARRAHRGASLATSTRTPPPPVTWRETPPER